MAKNSPLDYAAIAKAAVESPEMFELLKPGLSDDDRAAVEEQLTVMRRDDAIVSLGQSFREEIEETERYELATGMFELLESVASEMTLHVKGEQKNVGRGQAYQRVVKDVVTEYGTIKVVLNS